MKRKKRCILIIIISFVIIAAIVATIIMVNKHLEMKDKESRLKYYSKDLTENYNPNIMVVGEDFGIQKYMECRYLDSVTEESLLDGRDYGYNCIILSDINGTLQISDEELLLIKSYCEEKGYDMIYVGTSYFGKLVQLGFTSGFSEDERTLCYEGCLMYAEYYNVENKAENISYGAHGIWNKECDEHGVSALDEVLSMMDYYATKSHEIMSKNNDKN